MTRKNLLVDFYQDKAFWYKPCHKLRKAYYLESSEAIFRFVPIFNLLFCQLLLLFFSLFWKRRREIFFFLFFQHLLILFNTSYQLKTINLILSVLLFLSRQVSDHNPITRHFDYPFKKIRTSLFQVVWQAVTYSLCHINEWTWMKRKQIIIKIGKCWACTFNELAHFDSRWLQ